ncbi:MAG: hypothetical protein ACKO14_13380, partial [Armatimonadota bacterium]
MQHLEPDNHLSTGKSVAMLELEAYQWMTRMSPLVLETPPSTKTAAKRHLADLQQQLQTGRQLYQDIATAGLNPTIVTSIEQAIRHLPDMIQDAEAHITYLETGAANAEDAAEQLREKLARRAAQTEVDDIIGKGFEQPLQATTRYRNIPAAIGTGIFGIAWTSFTTVHAFFMIGGMMQAFGWAALFLLLFYSLFWAVGLGMLATSAASLGTETIDLYDGTLTSTFNLFGYKRIKKVAIDTSYRARVTKVMLGGFQVQN